MRHRRHPVCELHSRSGRQDGIAAFNNALPRFTAQQHFGPNGPAETSFFPWQQQRRRRSGGQRLRQQRRLHAAPRGGSLPQCCRAWAARLQLRELAQLQPAGQAGPTALQLHLALLAMPASSTV